MPLWLCRAIWANPTPPTTIPACRDLRPPHFGQLPDPLDTVEVGEHQDVEEFGTGSRSESIETGT